MNSSLDASEQILKIDYSEITDVADEEYLKWKMKLYCEDIINQYEEKNIFQKNISLIRSYENVQKFYEKYPEIKEAEYRY